MTTEEDSLKNYGIEPWLIKNLHDISISSLFTVQKEIIPFISKTEGHDICVCAPTGSGKTLSYAIPLVQKIVNRVIRRLKILVVVPTHDLVSQVEKTFKSIIKHTDLVVEYLGIRPFHIEQKLLVRQYQFGDHSKMESLVDILVSTPGRLVDHINETKGFTLEFLNYLVIDEADRLLRQSFQDWLEILMDSANSNNNMDIENNNNLGTNINNITVKEQGNIQIQEINVKLIDSTPGNHLSQSQCKLVKILLSATMTYNPTKISLLQLHAPLFFTTSKIKEIKYKMPETLKESYIISSTSEQRPLVLLNILKNTISTDDSTSKKKIICFTKSLETTHRLNLLLKFIQNVDGLKFVSEEYSSVQSQSERSALLSRFRNGEIDILICSDIMSRGMDIQDIDVVINYNAPPNITLYVHRVGRTARAGKDGSSYTIVEKQELKHYLFTMKKAERSHSIHKLKWKFEDYKPYEVQYKNALYQMRLIFNKRKTIDEPSNDTSTTIQSSMESDSRLYENLLEVSKKKAKANFNC
ncbi:putative RNA helicase [Tieghemostelium lacteum]|uniref:ATP-dependent RNA helicase n=1 Tax=Tieghemostelium lacteum TaxID=361077 RepID=A0A152A4W8_TIELA|nr:putative RNA helicase [Tieghemostelium lacteum]|eukprot:KYR01278.1 putative RNA helicase [Tieghemostelium lacteum]